MPLYFTVILPGFQMLFVTDEVSVITGFVIAGCHCIGKLDLKKKMAGGSVDVGSLSA